MPKPYPDANFSTMTGLFEHTNSLTDGWSVILFSVVVTITTFILLKAKGYRNSDSLLVSTAMAFVFSAFFWAMGLVQSKIPLLFLFLTIASAIYSIFDRD